MANVRYKLNTKNLRSSILNGIIAEQKRRLVEYAKAKINDIGYTFLTSETANNLDRTGNLLDSLCWGVAYDGKLVASGFFRKQKASEQSFLHEWFVGDVSTLYPVYGHGLAQQFLNNYESTHSAKGWQVFFAVLAPYWGYWEEGFTMRGKSGTKHLKLAIVTQHYDAMRSELKPMKVNLRVSVPKYTYMGIHSLMKSTTKSPSKERRHFNRYPEFKKPK